MSSQESRKSHADLSYTTLYRRWRPQLFSQIVGQEHVTRTLKNALLSSRIAHAYLFCGLRGTGKTTMAKLLAKALNCLEGVAQEPCNVCRSCLEITEGRSVDVIEIDAASNRGIDEIRDLREKIRYAAAASRYKVYIIDEVHMLTNEAFNALLKTLEEPPAKVVFILATTEVHKLPLTVISRCQRFEFHLLEADLLAAHLAKISREIDFSIDEETCTLLARLAEGSARDALGLLEQCRAYGNEGVVYEEALEILGLTHPELSYRLFTAVVEEQIGDGLAIINEVVSRGRDLHRFLRELILYLRKLLILQSGQDGEKALLEVPGLRPYLLKQKGMFDHTVILEMLEILQQLTFQMKGASQPQFHLELAFLRLIRAYRLGRYLSSGDLFRRLEELEEKLQSGDLSLQPSMPLKGVEDKERREQKDDLSPSRDETPIDEPPWDEASPPAIDSVSPPPGEKTEEKKNRLSFRKEGAAPLISPINGYVPLKGVEDKKRRDPEDDLPPPWDDAPIGNPPWDEIPIDNSPLDEPPWDDTPTPWDEAPPASPVSANKAAPKSEEPPKSEKPAESAFSFKSLIKSGERGAVAPPNESSSIIAEVPSKEYSSIEISDSPPPPPSAAAAAKSPARSRSNKKTSKDLAGSGHEEKDPYIQQVLDIFNGHLIDP